MGGVMHRLEREKGDSKWGGEGKGYRYFYDLGVFLAGGSVGEVEIRGVGVPWILMESPDTFTEGDSESKINQKITHTSRREQGNDTCALQPSEKKNQQADMRDEKG